jgi:hypothetical protein
MKCGAGAALAVCGDCASAPDANRQKDSIAALARKRVLNRNIKYPSPVTARANSAANNPYDEDLRPRSREHHSSTRRMWHMRTNALKTILGVLK